jgi:toxin ParE1/3/4
MRRLPVFYHHKAAADLENIFIHLVEQGAASSTARAFVARIVARCNGIGDVPEGFPARPDLGLRVRIAPFERSAVILYRPTDDGVEIFRVFYGGRDYETIMRSMGNED